MNTENRISFIISVAAAVIMLLVLLILYLSGAALLLWLVIIIPLIVFTLFFFISRLVINHPHTNLHSLNKGEESSRKGGSALKVRKKRAAGNNDIISDVEEEVAELEKLKGLETYRKEFLGNVYHELKTPIFNLQGYILTLLEGGLDDPEINRLYLERTEQNINRMISIVEDLESISGLESGALNLRMESFNIKKTVREVFEANEMRAKKFNVKLDTGRSKEGSIMVKGDKKRIFQVLNNLVMNSINYGVRNGRTTVNIKESGGKVLIEVTDDGIGISREDLPRIFERFYRVDKSRSRNSGGTGLGLAIVKHILEAHKQSIKVNSVPGEGSSFTFTLDKG